MNGPHPDRPGHSTAGRSFQYDVCLSFAGEYRSYVEKVAETLKAQGIAVYYYEFETVEAWGKNLYLLLDRVYRTLSRYCVVFVSKEYAERLWTRHELASALDRALREDEAYILPARFDDSKLPGLLDTIAYIDLRGLSAEKFASMVAEKLGVGSRQSIVETELPWPDDVLASPVKRPLTAPRALPPDGGVRRSRQRGRSEVPAWDIDDTGGGDTTWPQP